MNVDPIAHGRVRLDLGIDAERVHLAFFDHAFACGSLKQSKTQPMNDSDRQKITDHHDTYRVDLYDLTNPVLTSWEARRLAGMLNAAADRAERAS